MPLRHSDGSVSGTLCAARHRAKPELGYRELQFLQVLARLISDQLERQRLEAEKRSLELEEATAHTLVAAVSARDNYTREHSREVVERAGAVAALIGLSPEERADVEKVALLHDIGKIGVPDAILHKPGPLSEAEWETMRRHPVLAERLIGEVPGLDHLAPALRAEHERWDGRGYPDGLAGEQIPIASRITLVCDAYNAMTTDRPYRAALSPAAARREIAAGAGSQFCPGAAAVLLAVLAGESRAGGCRTPPSPTLPKTWCRGAHQIGAPADLSESRSGAVPKAGATGLEPATSGVTGRRSNQLSYAPEWDRAGTGAVTRRGKLAHRGLSAGAVD